ncbi:HAD family hydrolase [Lactimicrobium sp.]|jgi:phosphoglycolate phosphatase|uniref:HAD family hydrolase n=1 Tax=Lactimicrobium sp. TaxID=2563780 RepID=UPI002F356A61
MKYQAAVFDMDGTLLNTVADMGGALNHAMGQFGHRHDFTPDEIRSFFGSGGEVAICRALAVEKGYPLDQLEQVGTDHDEISKHLDLDLARKIVKAWEPYYFAHNAEKTAPYPGIVDLLKQLRKAGIFTAVVSNKPDPSVQVLAAKYFPDCFDFVVGKSEKMRRKPAPDMVLASLQAARIPPEKAAYIGDSEIDILTGRNAGTTSIAVAWGFRSEAFLLAHKPDLIVQDAAQLCKALME